MRKFLFILLFIFFSSQIVFSQVTQQSREFFSSSLNKNRDVIVYKPELCSETNPCPVLIFLPGWTQPESSFPFFRDLMNDLLNSGKIKPFLIVVPDGRGGLYTLTSYWNSIVNGNYGDYIAKDLVEWIANEYPVCQNSDGLHERAYWLIGGFSMGGGGCARLALKHNDVFSGFAAFSGDLSWNRFHDWFAHINTHENPDYIYSPPNSNQMYTYLMWGNSTAASPDTSAPFKAQFPLEEGTGTVRDSIFAVWQKANPLALANEYFNVNNNPAASMNVYIRVSPSDFFISFLKFSKDFSDSLYSWNVYNDFDTHTFGHDFNAELATDLLIWADRHFPPQISHQHDIELKSIQDQIHNINENAIFVPQVMLRNLGSDVQSNFQVTCEIKKEGIQVYTNTQTIDSLKSLEKFQVTFGDWSPLEQAVFELTFFSSLSSDENPSNDSLKITVNATEFIDDFESGFQKWYTKTGWDLTDQKSYLGNFSLASNPYGSYDNNMNYWVECRYGLNLENIQSAYLSFWHQYQIEPDTDIGYVAISNDGGTTWKQTGSTYSGEQLYWIEDIVSLKDYCGSGLGDIQIRFYLLTDEKQEIPMQGWSLDDIILNRVKLTHDIAVASILKSSFKLPILINFKPRIVARNIGFEDESNIAINCTIDTNKISVYTDELTIDNMESLTSHPSYFSDWVPFGVGDYNFNFFSSLNLDENNKNDSLKLTINVSNLIDAFEFDLTDWTRDSGWGVDNYPPHSGSYCLGNFPQGSYPTNMNAWIAYNYSFNLSQVESAYIKYWTKHYIEINHDFGFVEASADSGKTWNQLGEAYTGFRTTWEENWRSLADYCGPGFEQVLLRFRFISDSTQAFPALGWFLDDISIHEGTPPATNVFASEANLPTRHDLFNNYPNPFNPRTTIKYQIAEATKVRVIIYNLLGQKVKTLIDQKQQPGHFQVAWDGRNEIGQTVPSGVYFYKLETEQFSKVKKMLLLK